MVEEFEHAHDMWEKLKDMYEGTDNRRISQDASLLSDFKSLNMKDNESLTSYYNRYVSLITKLQRNKVHKTQHEINISFLQALNNDWKLQKSLIKSYKKVWGIICDIEISCHKGLSDATIGYKY